MISLTRPHCTAVLAGAVALLATLPLQADDTWKLQPLRYNNPGLEVDLGVGLWPWPLPLWK